MCCSKLEGCCGLTMLSFFSFSLSVAFISFYFSSHCMDMRLLLSASQLVFIDLRLSCTVFLYWRVIVTLLRECCSVDPLCSPSRFELFADKLTAWKEFNERQEERHPYIIYKQIEIQPKGASWKAAPTKRREYL